MDVVPQPVLSAARASLVMRRPGTVGLPFLWERRRPAAGADRRARVLRCYSDGTVRIFLDAAYDEAAATGFDLYVSVDPPQLLRAELLHVPGTVSIVRDTPPPIPFLGVPAGWVSLLLQPLSPGGDRGAAGLTLQTTWTKL